MGVTTASSVLKFSLKELEVLVKNNESQVYLKKDVKYPLKLTPACLQNVNQAITEILTAERLKYIPKYKGLLLAFKHVRRHSNMGTINDDECNILIHVHLDLYIFAPTVGCTMTGVVSKVGEDDIGCLVHKGFNVTLPRPRNDSKDKWIGSTLQLGDHVKFQLDTFNVVGTLPYIRGTLLSRVEGSRSSWSTELADACQLPTTSKLEKKKKSGIKEETELATLSPKKLSKKMKQAKGQEESVEDTDAVATTKKIKKRKSDPITMPLDPEPQGLSKKKAKLASESMTEAPNKSSLLQLLDSSDEEREVESRPSTVKAVSEKKTKQSKAAALNIVKPSRKSLSEMLASDSDEEDAEAGTKPITASGKTKKTVKKVLLEQKSDAGPKVDASSSEKKKKVKSVGKEKLSADKIGDMSIEALMKKAMDNVSGKTPKSKRSRALVASGATEQDAVQLPSSQSAAVQKQRSLLDMLDQDSDAPNKEKQPPKSPKKKKPSKPSGPADEANDLTAPAKSAAVQKQRSVLDMLGKDSDAPNKDKEPPKSPKKKKSSKTDGPLEKANDLLTPSKPLSNSVTGSAKRKQETSLSAFLQDDDDLPNPADLRPAQEERPKSPKKKKSTKVVELLENQPSSLKKKKRKSSLSSTSNDADARIELLEKLLKDVSGSLKKPKKAKITEPLENGETPSKLEKVSESSSSKKKKKSKSTPKDFLDNEEPDKMPLATGSLHSTGVKTPAKIKKAFVQSPIGSAPSKSETSKTPKPSAKTPLPTLPPLPALNEVSASKGSPKKSRKSEVGRSDLLQKLLNIERSVHFDNADESPTLPKSGKKKGKH